MKRNTFEGKLGSYECKEILLSHVWDVEASL